MKKQFLPLLLVLCLLIACAPKGNVYHGTLFDATMPDGFAPVENAGMLCFAPNGDPLLNSSITFYTTEPNWYFDRFTDEDYQNALIDAGYPIVSFDGVTACRIDSYEARRIECRVQIDQGEQMLVVYAVSSYKTYFFTLLNRDGDRYIEPFDAMMKTVHLKGVQ